MGYRHELRRVLTRRLRRRPDLRLNDNRRQELELQASRAASQPTTMRYDHARTNLDRQPNYILAAYMASAT
ncbi:hypothetical protein ACWEOO_38415 [Kribbella sp. NPDC004138]